MRSVESNEIGAMLYDHDGFPRGRKRAREKKEFTHFDQERIDKAQLKRARKNAKRLRQTRESDNA